MLAGLRGHLHLGHVVVELLPVRGVGQHRVARLPGLGDEHGQEREQERPGEQPAGAVPDVETVQQLTTSAAADHRPHDQRHEGEYGAAQRRVVRQAGERALNPLDLGVGLRGDEGVPLDQLLGGPRLGLAEGDLDADHGPRGSAHVGQERPGTQRHVVVRRRPDDRVVTGHRRRRRGREEQRRGYRQSQQQPGEEVRPRARHLPPRRPAQGQPRTDRRAPGLAGSPALGRAARLAGAGSPAGLRAGLRPHRTRSRTSLICTQ